MLTSREERMARKLAITSFCFLAALPILISSVGAYLYDFEDGIGPGWHFEGRTDWHLDETASHDGGSSLRSGEIKCTGTSSIYRCVEGPCEISFWWKKHPSSGPYGKGTVFTFSVNGVVQQTCDFSDWRRESYTIPENGTYEIRWDFKKITCYPQSEGAGWIDEVNVTSEQPISYESRTGVCICPQGLPGPKGDSLNWRGTWDSSTDYSKLDIIAHNGSSYLCIENNSGQEPPNVDYWGLLASKGDQGLSGEEGEQGLRGPKGESLNWRGTWDSSTDYSKLDVIAHNGSSYLCIENNSGQEPPNPTFWDLLASKGESGLQGPLGFDRYKLINDIKATQSRINISKSQRENNVVYANTSNLQEVINRSTNKTIYLEDGIYYGSFKIFGNVVNNLTIKPENECGATLNGVGFDCAIVLYKTSNISIEDVQFLNGYYGIIIDDSKDCEIKNNILNDFNISGLFVTNDSQNIMITDNTINNKGGNDLGTGIWLEGSNNIFIRNNIIDVNSYAIYMTESYENAINITSDCVIGNYNVTIFDNGNAYKIYKLDDPMLLGMQHTFVYDTLFKRNIDCYNLIECSQ